MRPSIRDKTGQGLLEAVLAMALFGFIALALISLALGGFGGILQGGDQTRAEFLAQEGIEAVRAIRDRAWNENIYAKSAVADGLASWAFSGEGTEDVIGKFTRIISFESVCRDSGDEIAVCPGAYTDVHSKKIIVEVEWSPRPGIISNVMRESYITNWDTFEWEEDLKAEFDDGVFLDTETSDTLGDGDGSVTLIPL